MPYYDSETIERARQVDLLTYLQTCEPQELVHVSGNVYCTKTHDSLRISNGKWCWFSRGIGGYSALDYLIKVNGYSFMDAMETITGRAAIKPPSFVPAPKEDKPKHLLLPKAASDNQAMVDYLKKRGIDPEVIDYCVQTGRLYESRNKGHSNVVFVGFDKDGKARFGCLRGIGEGRFLSPKLFPSADEDLWRGPRSFLRFSCYRFPVPVRPGPFSGCSDSKIRSG